MSGRFWALACLCSGFALLHCGGTVTTVSADGAGGAAGHAGQVAHAGSPSTAGSGGSGGNSLPLDASFDEYADPGCPDASPPSETMQCDPFAAVSGCPAGLGCYPFVDHPFGKGCGEQTFGTECLIAGSGTQGAVCGDGANDCASGYVCVVGSQPGEHCVKLCQMTDPNGCPRGMICGELDVEGYGVCS
ncbi:MAG TPA: hypothetical protein VGM44_01200 [Polyangiaceae bacterium]|jgi:hypothetical protein